MAKKKISGSEEVAHREFVESIGQRVKDARVRAGYSQRDLAEKSRLTQAYIYLLEAGGQNPTVVTLKILADAMETDIRDFFPEHSRGVPTTASLERMARAVDKAGDVVRIFMEELSVLRSPLAELPAMRQQLESLMEMLAEPTGGEAEDEEAAGEGARGRGATAAGAQPKHKRQT
jgi:transcriptional regulator with XRE-family HTH domain